MSLEETKRLLRTYRIMPNKVLGQNFMVEPAFFNRMCNYSLLSQSDVVLDAGAGLGFLSRFLANKCKAVIAVEKDPIVATVLRDQIKGCSNVTIIEGDVLKVKLPDFTKVVAIPPYYLSSRLVTWLFECKIDSAILILQREFASRLVATPNNKDYGWISILAYQKSKVELFDPVPKTDFYPQPQVDSVIVRLKPRIRKSFEVKDEAFFVKMVKWLFSQRNKKVGKALVPFLKNYLRLSKEEMKARFFELPFQEQRARELTPQDFGVLADDLCG